MTIRAFDNGLRSLGSMMPDYTAALSRWMTDDLHRAIADRESVYGVPHKPLAPATVKKKGHDHQLIESWALNGSLQAISLATTTIGIECAPDYVEYHVGVRTPYPRDTMPATWQAEAQRLLTEMIDEALGNR